MIADLAKRILRHYGLRHQKAKTIEELAELIVALQKDILSGNEGLSKEVIEEIADVHIMLTQLLNDEGDKTQVSFIVDRKLKRQIKRIEKEKEADMSCKKIGGLNGDTKRYSDKSKRISKHKKDGP